MTSSLANLMRRISRSWRALSTMPSPGLTLHKKLRSKNTRRSRRNSKQLRIQSCRNCTLRQVQVQVEQKVSPVAASQVALREVHQEVSPALVARTGLVLRRFIKVDSASRWLYS